MVGGKLCAQNAFRPGAALDKAVDGFRRVTVVDESALRLEHARELFRKYQTDQTRVLVVNLCATPEDAMLMAGKSHAEYDYTDWERSPLAHSGPVPEVPGGSSPPRVAVAVQ